MTDRSSEAGAQRDETPMERLDRNPIELLNELRVAGTGRLANELVIAGMSLLALGFVGILILRSDVVLGGAAPVIIGALAAAFVARAADRPARRGVTPTRLSPG